MKSYNLSPTKDTFYSQRNNAIAPGVTCKPTSTVMALDIAGWPLPTGDYKQPEDNLTAWCRSPDGYQALARFSPANPCFPNEDWKVIAEAINSHFLPGDKPVIGPRWNWDLKEVLHGLAHGVPFAASTFLTTAGHVVTMVGFETTQDELPVTAADLDMTKVTAILIDDPYGNHQAPGGYAAGDLNGWNNRYTLPEWLLVWRQTGIQIRPKKEK